MPRRSKDVVRSLFNDSGEDLLRYLVSRMPNEEDAREMAQEAYLRLLRRDKADLVRHPKTYLFRIATNLIHEHWIKPRPESMSRDLDPDALEGQAASPEVLAEQAEAVKALERALRLLPPLQQRAVLMHRRDGLTYDEIAQELGCSPGMVRKYLRKGLVRCREYIRRY